MKKKVKVVVALIMCMVVGMYASAASSRTAQNDGKPVAASVTIGAGGLTATARIDCDKKIYLEAKVDAYLVTNYGGSGWVRGNKKIANLGKSAISSLGVTSGGRYTDATSYFAYGDNGNPRFLHIWDDLVW